MLLDPRYREGGSPRPADNDTLYDGLIAQEVKAALKTLGQEWSGWSANESDGKQGIQYGTLTVPLIRGVQELDVVVQELKATVQARDAAVEQLEPVLQARDAVIAAQQAQLEAVLARLAALEQQLTE